MPVTGKCPACGLQIASPQEIAEASEYKAPWHFKLMVVLAVLYLSFRFVQVLSWII